jgi:hypothetical protein
MATRHHIRIVNIDVREIHEFRCDAGLRGMAKLLASGPVWRDSVPIAARTCWTPEETVENAAVAA